MRLAALMKLIHITPQNRFRLACVQTIYLDFEYAVAERTDQIMWLVHTSINNEYRKALVRLRHLAQNSDKQKTDKTANEKRIGDKDKNKGEKQTNPKQKGDKRNVERRKFGDKYLGFLHVAQEFYKGYVQRLSARYDIPELKRIAQGVEVDGSPSSDVVSPVPDSIYPLVINSCHFTLICLGDLARYQVQSGLKKSSYKVALAYYSLAHDLKPDSGFPFHQMGMISLEEGKDLDILYYFYRSIATADPHPNVKQNLESQFKSYFQPDKNPPKKQARGPSDAFVTWFTKLHASFYRGETMAGSGELEREVLHRLDMASKNPDYSEVLFRMSLINMSSYFIATQKYTGRSASHKMLIIISNAKQRHKRRQLHVFVTILCVSMLNSFLRFARHSPLSSPTLSAARTLLPRTRQQPNHPPWPRRFYLCFVSTACGWLHVARKYSRLVKLLEPYCQI